METKTNKVPYRIDDKKELPKSDKIKFYHEDEYAFAHFIYDEAMAVKSKEENK